MGILGLGDKGNEMMVKGYRLLAIRWINAGELMYTMVIIVKTIYIMYLETIKRVHLKCPHKENGNHERWCRC